METTIRFTPEMITQLRAKYDKAVAEGQTMFVFDGKDILVVYAKYLLEYLEGEKL